MAMHTIVDSVIGTGMSGSKRTSSAPTGTTVLTSRSALPRLAIHQMPRINTALGIVTVNDAARSDSSDSPVSTAISTLMPAEKAPAAAKTT